MSTLRVDTITDFAGSGGPGFSNGLTVTGTVSVTGAITATGDITAFFSDDRLKTRLGSIENALDKISQIQGFYYEPNDTAISLGYTNMDVQVGVSAQEVQTVMPEVVAPAPISDEYLTVKYEKLTPLIIEAIKELRMDLEEVKKSIEEIRSESK